MATALEMRWQKPAGTAKWSVGKRHGHLQDVVIKLTSDKADQRLIKRHAH